MEVLNLAASALFDVVEKHHLAKSVVVEGTTLKLENILNVKKKHNWNDYVKMFDNCEKYLGTELAAKEIGYYGIFNEDLSILRRTVGHIFDVKLLYWYLSKFISKFLFKGCVIFNYSAVNSECLKLEITIRPELKDNPLLLKAYTHLMELIPTTIGLPRARVEATIKERKGEYYIYIKQVTLLKRLANKFLQIFSTNKNSIELLEQLEIQSQEISKMADEKSQLLRVVCHDVANQVIAIDYYLNSLNEKIQLGSEEEKIIKATKSSASKLNNILKNVQNLELTSFRGVKLHSVNVYDVFEYLKEDFDPQLKLKNISLVINYKLPINTFVMAESSALEISILGNLLSNAIKFSDEGSKIELGAKLVGDDVHIMVIDEGIGLSKEDEEKLFTQSLRKSLVGTKGEKGSGIGLGIVARYVELFEGKIEVEANRPKGAIFTVQLKAYRL